MIRLPTPKDRQAIRDLFAGVNESLTDEECDNIWRFGCSIPDPEMRVTKKLDDMEKFTKGLEKRILELEKSISKTKLSIE